MANVPRASDGGLWSLARGGGTSGSRERYRGRAARGRGLRSEGLEKEQRGGVGTGGAHRKMCRAGSHTGRVPRVTHV